MHESGELTWHKPPFFSFISMFIRPTVVLSGLKERPNWFGPLVFAALYGAVVNYYVVTRIGFLRMIRDVLRAAPAVDPKAVLEAAFAGKAEILLFQGISTIASTFFTALVVAQVLWLMLELIGAEIRFRRIMAVVAHVSMSALVIRESMLALAATVMHDLENLDLRNPLATNPAFFLRPGSPVLLRLLSSLDLLTFLQIFLLAIGLSRMSARLSFWKAILLVTVPWGVYTAASVFLPIWT